jgi:hypothetical protein
MILKKKHNKNRTQLGQKKKKAQYIHKVESFGD